MLPPELANPFRRPPAVPLNPDTAGMVGDMLCPEAKKAFEALDDEPSKPRAKPTELTEEEKAAMREAQKRLERSRELLERFQTWRTVPLGEYKTAEELTAALKNVGFKINDLARSILEKITISNSTTSVELVNVSVEGLGFDQQATTEEIYDRARELGLSLCPAEVGPALRLYYSDQPMDKWLFVAMESIADSNGDLGVLALKHDSDGFRLYVASGCSSDTWNTDSRWVFVRSKQK